MNPRQRPPSFARDHTDDLHLPRPLRVGAAVSWRLLIIAALVVVLYRLGTMLFEVLLPVAVAVLLAALLTPVVRWLVMKGVHRTLASAAVLIGGLAAVGGVLTLVVNTAVRSWPQLQSQILASVQALHRWLRRGPLGLSEAQLNHYFSQALGALRSSQSGIASSALTTASALASFAAGILLGLFTLFFLLRDGGKIWRFVQRVSCPPRLHDRLDAAGRRGFAALVAYVRATAVVALTDALLIGAGAAIVGVPLAPALAALVFLGAFVPYAGGVVSGSIAVLVALATQGLASALIVLLIVLGTMQLEGHVLQPLLLGRAARLHPLAVVLSITAGFVIVGVAGAVLAVPFVAVLTAAVRSWTGERSHAGEIDPYDPRHSKPEREPAAAGAR